MTNTTKLMIPALALFLAATALTGCDLDVDDDWGEDPAAYAADDAFAEAVDGDDGFDVDPGATANIEGENDGLNCKCDLGDTVYYYTASSWEEADEWCRRHEAHNGTHGSLRCTPMQVIELKVGRD